MLQRGGSFGCLARECGVAWRGVANEERSFFHALLRSSHRPRTAGTVDVDL